MKKYSNVMKYLICFLIIFFCSFVLISKIFENDLFFDLKTGESILKYGIDFKDHFSFIANLKYIYHHWLYDLIIYFIYILGGYDLIFIFFLIIFSAFGITVFCVNKKYSNMLVSLFATLYTMIICSYGFQSRVQSITYILFFLEIYFLERLYKSGEKKYIIGLVLISIFIANLHMPLWIFCLILCLPYVVETLFCIFLKKKKNVFQFVNLEKPFNSKLILVTFCILLFTGLLTPLKLYPYLFFTKSLFNNSYFFIAEMEKTQLYYYYYYVMLLVFVLICHYLKFVKFTLRDFMLLVGLFLFSLIAVRNIIYFQIICPTVLVKSFIRNKNFPDLSAIFNKFNLNVILTSFTVILVSICSFSLYGFFSNVRHYGIVEMYPDEIVQYIKENLDYKNIKIYNDFNYGSYLEFNDIPVFIDSRAEVYIKEFNGGYNIVSDYIKASSYSTYKEIMNKYNFDYILISEWEDIYSCVVNDSDYELIMNEPDAIGYYLFKKIDNTKHKK